MTDWLLALVPTYGMWLLAACTFASCLAIPIPASILMLAAGGFVAAGDLPLPGSFGAALGGAVAGDQLGFAAGRHGGAGLIDRLGSRAAPVARAREMLARRGGIAVFLSRWLVSALGPYVNLAAGAAGLPWARFTLWGALGEAVWVGLYIGLGFAFTGNLQAASDLALQVLGFLGAGAAAIGLGAWLVVTLRGERQEV
jgi:membrane protein DedA with SNARE-associated domain